MENERIKEGSSITLKDLYPHFTDEQIKEAEENLERYLDLVLRIYNRIQREPEDMALRFDSPTETNYDGARKVESHIDV